MTTYKIGYAVRYYENIHKLKYTFKRISKRDAIRAYNNGLRVIVTTKNALPCDYMNYDGNIISRHTNTHRLDVHSFDERIINCINEHSCSIFPISHKNIAYWIPITYDTFFNPSIETYDYSFISF